MQIIQFNLCSEYRRVLSLVLLVPNNVSWRPMFCRCKLDLQGGMLLSAIASSSTHHCKSVSQPQRYLLKIRAGRLHAPLR